MPRVGRKRRRVLYLGIYEREKGRKDSGGSEGEVFGGAEGTALEEVWKDELELEVKSEEVVEVAGMYEVEIEV